MDPHGNGVVSKTNDVFATISPVFETHGISPTFTLLPKLLFSIITELSEKQQKERNYEIFSSIEQYEKGYPNETAVLGWILVLGSGEGNSRYVHKG